MPTDEKALPDFNQAMIALLPDETDRGYISAQVFSAFEGSSAELMSPERYHITVANLGPLTLTDVANLQRAFQYEPVERIVGRIGGAGYFTPSDEERRVMVLHYDSPQLHSAKNWIDSAISTTGITPSSDHGFNPHITIARGDDISPLDRLDFGNQTLIFNRLFLVFDDFMVPLGYDRNAVEIENMSSVPMKSYELSPEGDLWIYVYGVPFRGPEFLEGKDLDGEYFDENTDIGPLEKVLSYWDHAKGTDVDPLYRKVREYFGKDLIGVAEKVAKDDEGWLYRIIVDRRKKYFELLKRLAEEKMLSASSTPHQRSVEKDADGHWKRWHVVEVTLTVQPNNPNARQLEKTISDLLGDDMSKKTTPETEQEVPVAQSGTEETPAPEKDAPEAPETPLTEQLGKIFNGSEDAESSEEEISLAKAIMNLTEKIAALEAKLDKVDQVEKSVNEVKLAFPVLAQHVKDLIGGGVRREKMSPTEQEAEDEVRQKMFSNPRTSAVSYLPPDAPGLN